MNKIKKTYSEYFIDFEEINFLKIHDLKIKVFKYLIHCPMGVFEAVLNIQVEEKYKYDPNIEMEPEDYFQSFVGFGDSEDEAIENLIDYINERENIELLKKSKTRVSF